MRAASLVLCILFAATPFAALASGVPEPGMYYRVVDVAPSDMLNVRGQPGTSSPVVARLRPDARDVVVTGLRQPVGNSMWWEVVHERGRGATGWVNARFMAPMNADAASAADFPLQCGGTEPFWSLAIADRRARFSTPESERSDWTAGAWTAARARPLSYRFAVRLEAAGSAEAGWAALTRAEPPCSDGMSDFDYPYDVILITPAGEVLDGCCKRAR